MSTLKEQIEDLKLAILDQHNQIIKAVNICNADNHIIYVSRIATKISLNYLGIIENNFIFKKTPKLETDLNGETKILVDILTKNTPT